MLVGFGEDGEEDGAGKDACAVVGQLGGPVHRYHKISDIVIITKSLQNYQIKPGISTLHNINQSQYHKINDTVIITKSKNQTWSKHFAPSSAS